MAKRGIDISAHQGNIDLSALKDQIDFVEMPNCVKSLEYLWASIGIHMH